MVGLDEQCLNTLFDEFADWEDSLSHCEFYKNPANSSKKGTDNKDEKAPKNPKNGGVS